jgi:hypothetical protein
VVAGHKGAILTGAHLNAWGGRIAGYWTADSDDASCEAEILRDFITSGIEDQCPAVSSQDR